MISTYIYMHKNIENKQTRKSERSFQERAGNQDFLKSSRNIEVHVLQDRLFQKILGLKTGQLKP